MKGVIEATMNKNDSIKKFARTALECGCEEEVFRTIIAEDNITISGSISLLKKINIGNRLLIYITKPIPDESLHEALTAIIAYGKNERDTAGFNRLRIVIPDSLQIYTLEDAENVLRTFEGADEKIHVHITGQSDLTPIL